MINIQISKKVFNDAYLPLLHNKARYLVIYGGAGSGKSYFIAERYIHKLLDNKKFNLLVVRAVGNTNRDSTFALFKQIISRWGLYKHFKVNESELRIKCLLNGNEIIFKGLDDTEKLKSVTFAKGELTDVWMEEASEALEEDFNQLDLRLRGIGTDKQITISFNPIDINHWLKKRFFDKKSDDVFILHTTYKDNKFLDDKYKEVLESYKETDPYYYDVYCLGQWGVLGKTVFDARKINERLSQITRPLKIGYFIYQYDGLKISEIKWVNDPNGYIKLYELPNIYKYTIGGDTAGEGSDYFTGQVIRADTGTQVATLKHQMDEDLYAKQMYCLGAFYKWALLAPEVNFSTYPTKELERLGYPNLYVRQREDTYTGTLQKSFGFKTTSLTRPLIISELIKLVREETQLFNDKETLEEMLTFVRNEKGRPEAQQGTHDDLIMALAIAHYVKDQVVYNQEPIITPFKPFFTSDSKSGLDWGEKVEVI